MRTITSLTEAHAMEERRIGSLLLSALERAPSVRDPLEQFLADSTVVHVKAVQGVFYQPRCSVRRPRLAASGSIVQVQVIRSTTKRRANNTIKSRDVQSKFWFPCELRQSGSPVVHTQINREKNSCHPRQSTYAVGEVRTHALIRTSGLKSDTLTTRSRRQAIIK